MEMFDLLRKYGYDGATYPMKEVIITETNIAHKSVSNYIGSQEAQRNYAIKLAVLSQVNEICGIYIYGPWDNKESSEASTSPYDFMGFYKPIPESPGQPLRLNDAEISWRTMTALLSNSTYDAGETSRLNLPTDVNGAAFYSNQSKDYIYVLWASTADNDQNENTSANYSFPSSMNVSKTYTRQWDNKSAQISGSTFKLTGAPVFVKVNEEF